MFRLAYNTNGLAHHRLVDALRLLAELGYEGCAVTPDVGQLDLYRLDPAEVRAVRETAVELGLELTVETGARYLMDPRRKHFPTLLEAAAAERARRVDFTRRAIDLAAELGAPLVSVWSGAAPDGVVADSPEALGGGARDVVEPLWDRLVEGLRAVLAHAVARDVQIGFEPEPGMFVERPAGWAELVGRLGPDGTRLGLTLDVGHLLCTGDLPVARVIAEHATRLVHVHLDDVRGGVHEHRMFGEGDLDLRETVSALSECGYEGLAAVELSRDSHRGAWAAAEALARLRGALAP